MKQYENINMISIEKNVRNCLLRENCFDKKIAIYGTGKGAEKVWNELGHLNCEDKIKYIFDSDEKINEKIDFHNKEVVGLRKETADVDLIFVGAEINHIIIKERIVEFIKRYKIPNIKVIDPFQYEVTLEDKEAFLQYLNDYYRYDDFVPIANDDYVPQKGDSKVIAWYLPQFYQMEINNKYHGQGFTEWTNTSQTFPQFLGHYQPHIPYDVGYYTLLNPETLARQAFLAHKYGVYGFAFYYYWFSGTRIMEKPLQLLLEHKEIDIKFCVNWATDDWSMSWYGKEGKMVLKQEIPEVESFWESLEPLFRDKRYIYINEKPLFVVYRCTRFEQRQFSDFINKLQLRAKKAGFKGIYVMLATAKGSFDEAEKWGGDALVEYQPWHIFSLPSIKKVIPCAYLNPNFRGRIFDIGDAIEKREYLTPHKSNKYFRCAMTAWDNTARKKETDAWIMLGNSPERMKDWLVDIMKESKKIHTEEENYVFVSSWNEWAEGSHLEPDYRYGYAWLDAVKMAHELTRG